nr:helix-turn-helix transcriptional regulator [Nitrosomonas nitrosa]
MASTLHDPRYRRLIEFLVAARRDAGLTQRDLAARLKQPPSYIGKLESRQRRLDVIELVDIAEALGLKPSRFIADAIAELRKR